MKKKLFACILALSLAAAPAAAFDDVPADAYYRDAVAWAVERGITGGSSMGLFDPESPCTTEQMVAFLWRAQGQPEPAAAANPFTDIAPSSPSYKAALWAHEAGLVSGPLLAPSAPCTRGQTVSYLWKLAGRPAPAVGEIRPLPGEAAAVGILGDTLINTFFAYSIDGAAVADAFGAVTAAEGRELLVVDVTVRNTDEWPVPMYDTDFQLQWGGEGPEDFAYPLAEKSGQLPAAYTLAVGEEVSGKLVYEIPAGSREFTISYRESFDDGTTGSLFRACFAIRDGQAAYPTLFDDVALDAEYAQAVLWALRAQIASGTGGGFSPDTACTRGQIMTFLHRAYGAEGSAN